MKIALICPSNMLYMPYVNNYQKILKANNVNYDIINWDRFHIEDMNNGMRYRDKKVGHQRNFFDYYRYSKFIIRKLEENKYERLIVFGIQILFFLRKILTKNYRENFIIDIRDQNKIINIFNIKALIDNSVFTVISSPGYQEWLPDSNKYIVNHNTQVESIDDLRMYSKEEGSNKKLNIACIGAIRDQAINIDFINSMKNSTNTDLYFHGEGDINLFVCNYLKENKINNVFFTGRYKKENEESLYINSSLINVLRYNDGINNKTALPNRLYNAPLYGKPMLAFEGTHLSQLVKEYGLGLVVDSFEGLENRIYEYLEGFNPDEYNKARIQFFRKVIEDNTFFKNSLTKFVI